MLDNRGEYSDDVGNQRAPLFDMLSPGNKKLVASVITEGIEKISLANRAARLCIQTWSRETCQRA
jgi:hypothetical protein